MDPEKAAPAADARARLRVSDADFTRDYAAIRLIRFTVFVDEQQVAPELELDDRDPHCKHLLVHSGEAPIATGRIDLEYGGKIGRVAVLAAHRGSGAGSALMLRLHEIARAAGLRETWCHAQVAAAPFYARLGYRATGEPFDEAGIEHVLMRHAL
jgi:predicted GNAT family N-acyltransferase